MSVSWRVLCPGVSWLLPIDRQVVAEPLPQLVFNDCQVLSEQPLELFGDVRAAFDVALEANDVFVDRHAVTVSRTRRRRLPVARWGEAISREAPTSLPVRFVRRADLLGELA